MFRRSIILPLIFGTYYTEPAARYPHIRAKGADLLHWTCCSLRWTCVSLRTWRKQHICITLGQIYELKWNHGVFNIYLNGAVLMITLRVDLCKRNLTIGTNPPNQGMRRRKMSTRRTTLELATSFVLTTENLERGCRSWQTAEIQIWKEHAGGVHFIQRRRDDARLFV